MKKYCLNVQEECAYMFPNGLLLLHLETPKKNK